MKMMKMETLKCFNCHIEKPLSKFKDNKRAYQIKSAKGKCIICKACSFHKALKTLSVVRYDFEEKTFKVIHFENQYEVLDFFDKEGGEL